MHERARRVMPGLQSNFRATSEVPPIYFQSSEGLRYTDVDGKEYIDFVLGMGPAIWGHSNREYRDAIVAQLDTLFSVASSLGHLPQEIELAEKVVQHVPCADLVRFGMTGTEANQLAIRLARAYTGKPLFVRFDGHYHGWLDNVFGGGLSDQEPPHAELRPVDSGGLGPYALRESLKIPWNDLQALEAVLEKYIDEIGLVLMEPIMCNFACCPPREGYLAGVRDLCTKYGVLLCFDEVITGFRVGIGGAQGEFGVTPDLAILGKALAGGLPLSAVAGRADVMEYLRNGKVLGGGTFNSFPLATAAAVRNIEMLERGDGAYYRSLGRVQARLMEGLRESAARHGHDVLVQGPAGMFYLDFIDIDVAWVPTDLARHDAEKQSRFRALLHEEGVIIGGGSRFVVSGALEDRDIDDALERIDTAMSRL